jgi:hypothetical protein
MDPQRFDRFTREIGNQTDRRRVFKSVAAGALAAFGVGVLARQTRAASGKDGDSCTTSSDCETGLVCEGASSGLLGGLIAEGNYGPPGTSTLFGPSDGTCRYRSDNCAKSGQYCNGNGDCCNGLNLECHNHKCRRRN